MFHATEYHVQLILCNYTNLQLHVSHATEFYLQKTGGKPKISSSEFCKSFKKIYDNVYNIL